MPVVIFHFLGGAWIFPKSLWRLVAAPAPGPAAAVGELASASVVVGGRAGATGVTSPSAGHPPVTPTATSWYPPRLPPGVLLPPRQLPPALLRSLPLLFPPREDRAGISRLATGSELMIQGSLGAALFLTGVGLAGTLAGSASMSSTIEASLSARTL
jgi:hypothetical protein